MMKTFLSRFLMILLLLNTAACKETEEEPQPQADFTFTEPLRSRAPIRFEATAPGATKYRWNFGDGGKDSVANPMHIFAAAGNYTVTLVVDGPNGTATKSKPLEVGPGLAIDFQLAGDTWSGAPVSFATIASSWATSYQWNFGDGATSTVPDPVHTFAQPGTYPVTLTATGPTGTAILTRNVVVLSPAAISDGLAGKYRCDDIRLEWMRPWLQSPTYSVLPEDTIIVSALPDGQLKLQANGSLFGIVGLFPAMKLYPGTGLVSLSFPIYWYRGDTFMRPSEDAYFERQGTRLVYRQWTGGNAGWDRYSCNCQKL